MPSDVPFMTPRAIALGDALMEAPLFERLGDANLPEPTSPEIVLARAKDHDDAVRRMASPTWHRALSDAINEVLAAYREVGGMAWYQENVVSRTQVYAEATAGLQTRFAAKATDAGVDPKHMQFAPSALAGMLAAQDLLPVVRLEFHLTLARIYEVGHLPCGWTGRGIANGTLWVL